MENKKIKVIKTKLGVNAVYYESTKNHILQSHPETDEALLSENITEVLVNPDIIREGRFLNTTTYFKITDISSRPFEGMSVHTKDTEEETIVTTFFEGQDKIKQKVIWSKSLNEN